MAIRETKNVLLLLLNVKIIIIMIIIIKYIPIETHCKMNFITQLLQVYKIKHINISPFSPPPLPMYHFRKKIIADDVPLFFFTPSMPYPKIISWG